MTNEKQIFPREIIEDSVEKHFQQYNPRNRVLYMSVLGLCFFAFLLLFIIRTDVTVRSVGTIRSTQERTDIRAPVNGIVDSVFISENMHVRAGQSLVKIKSESVQEKGIAARSRYEELRAQLADVKLLLGGADSALQSELYQQQNLVYKQRLNDAQTKLGLAQKTYGRFAGLYRSRAISAAEFDRYSFDYESAQNELKLIQEQQRSQWQGDLTRLNLQLKESEAQRTAFQEEQDLYNIKAPVSGTVQKLKSLSPGTFVSPTELLGEISPDSGLIAEAFVSTKDIGLLRDGASVRMSVDAYDYNNWGFLKGTVVSISDDVFTDAAVPYFKVRCLLDKTVMSLRNGYKGALKKGMTVQARFIVTRRSLFQLLWDKTDDWLNPNTIKTQQQKNGGATT